MSATYPIGKHPNSRRRRGVLLKGDRRNRTGVVGISLVRTANGKRDGRARSFYSAHAGGTNRKFSIEQLGVAEAFRRAVEFRAAHEREVGRRKAEGGPETRNLKAETHHA